MFVATVRRPAAWIERLSPRLRSSGLHRGMALFVVVSGAYGQLQDCLNPPPTAWSNIHVGFGAILLLTIVLRMRADEERCAADFRVDACMMNRRLALRVYTLLYTLAGLRELGNIGVYLWHGGTFHLGDLVIGREGAALPPALPGLDSFQVYVSYAFVAIIVIRTHPFRARPR